MFRLIQIGRRSVGAGLLIAPLVAFLWSNQFEVMKLAFSFGDPFSISQYRMSRLSNEQYENEIQEAIKEEDFSDAQALVAIATENGRKLPTDLVLRTQENSVEVGLRNAKDFLNGAVTGDVTSAASIGGVLAADYVGVGDVRDVVVQGSRLINGDDFDRLTLGLALAGLTTVVPGSGPADAGLSMLKTANKAGKISQRQIAELKTLALKIIDTEGLKRGLSRISLPGVRTPSIAAVRATFKDINWRGVATGDFAQFRQLISNMLPIDVKAAKDAFKGAVRKDSLDEVNVLASSATGIVSKGGIKAALRVIEHADDSKELSRFHTLAVRLGDKTSAVVKVLGKNAIKLGNLIYMITSMFVAVLGWLIAASWYVYTTIRAVRRASKRIVGTA